MTAVGPPYCFVVTTPSTTEFAKEILRGKKLGKQGSKKRRDLCSAPLKRLVHRIGPRCCVEKPWITKVTDVDIASNEKLTELEIELDKAVYEEDEERVSEIQEEISRLQATSYVDVLSANMKFYQAFSKGSLVDMGACWLKDNDVTCKHPLGPIFTGFWNVVDSFGAMFLAGIPDVAATDIRISMRGSVALVTCEERANIVPQQGDEDRRALATEWNENFSPEPAAIIMSATNIFEKKNGQWYLVHHVSSPATPLD